MDIAAICMRAIARAVVSKIPVHAEGLEHVPAHGPALLICRHYHHLYDGAALWTAIPRPVRIVVGLDWAKDRTQRAAMELLCRIGRWPVVLRDPAGKPWGGGYRHDERRTYARTAILRSLDLLQRGELLAVFPEGSPLVDPVPHEGRPEWPAFEGGYLSIAWSALRTGLALPLVPVGIAFEGPAATPQAIVLRFGAPEWIASVRERDAVGRRLEARVRELSLRS